MRDASRSDATKPRPPRRTAIAALTAATLGAALLAPAAAAAAEEGTTTFSSSFEADDAAPVLSGTGDPQNISGDRFAPGSALPLVDEVTASDENPPQETADRLADGSAASKWLVFDDAAWAQYRLSEGAALEAYTLTSGNDAPERDPRDFRLLGSHDGSDWTVLDERTGESFSKRGETRTFELEEQSEAFAFYRLDISANQSGGIIQLAGWEPVTDLAAERTPSDLALDVHAGPADSHTAKTGVGFTGVQALRYMGEHLADGPASSSGVLYDDLDVEVASDTQLSYVVFPELDDAQTYASTFVAVDVVFDDGEVLSATGATDTHGFGADARSQGSANVLWPDQWNQVTVDLGAFAGRTVTGLLLDYDHPGADVTGVEPAAAGTSVRGWIDDVSIAPAEPIDASDGLVSYVDTRRGTNSSGGFSRGNNIPAAGWPNGFNFVTPMTDADNVGSIYQYQRSNTAQNLPALEGIGFSHQPSIWMGDRNQLAILPAATGAPTSSLDDRRLPFRHENETARPDLYAVTFENGISTEVVPTDHGAIYRFAFEGDDSSVLVDQLVDDSKLSVDGDVVSGWVDGGSGYPGRTRMFVYGTFDTQPVASGETPEGDRGTARYAAFDTSEDRTVELRISSSFLSQEQAERNHELELDGVSFDDAHEAVRTAWNDRLGVVHDVEGATQEQLVTLYSSLYRLNLYPNSQFENVGSADDPQYAYASPVSDVDGDATDTETNAQIVDGKVYVNNGFWDTYRTAWPLYGLLYPELSNELVDGFVQQYRDGGWIARWSSPGYADLMTGTSSDVAFAEVYATGSLDIDTALDAYDAALKNATVLPTSDAVGRKGLDQSIFLGYTESTTHESASWGLEGFINDYGIARMAASLADDERTPADRVDRLREEAAYFEARAAHYVEMFNPEAGTFTARHADGSWAEDADFDKKQWGGAFTEASAWTFAFHAPHDVDGLAALYGGRQGLVDELHAFLTERERADYSGIHEAREARDVRLGMLGMSNQVAHHIPYVLAEAGDPSGAQELIRDIQNRLFVGSEIGQGYPGDEDNGEFSAWYVFSALGFYPLENGSGNYTVGTPLFDRATLTIGDHDVVVSAPGASEGKTYVAGVEIDGQPVDETTFDGDLLRSGGEISFAMSDEPSDWGAKDLGEDVATPEKLVDATAAGRGTLTSVDDADVRGLVDDAMTSSATFESGSAELLWTSRSGPVRVGQYTLTGTDPDTAPASWTLSGSVDGKTWTELDRREGEAFAWDTQTRPFSVADEGAFTQLKLEVSSGDAELSLAEIELFATADASDGLDVTGADSQRVHVDELFDRPIATIVGEEDDASGYEVTVDYGDGSDAPEVSLVRDDLGGWRVVAPHTFTAPGAYDAAITVRDSAGSVATATSRVTVFRDQTLVGQFNGVCIGDLGEQAADCDGQGHGYPRDKLADDGFVQGETLPIPDTELTYDLPAIPAGEPDNLTGEGQTVSLDLGEGATQIAFVGTATEDQRDPEATLRFSDGSEQAVPIAFGDWVGASADPAFGNSVIAVSEGRLSGKDAESSIKNTAIYATAPVDLDRDDDGEPKTVTSLTMPQEEGDLASDGRVHVFAIASDGERAAAEPLAIEPAAVDAQTTGEPFEALLATTTGGAEEQTAIVNWGDGSPVQAVEVADGEVIAEHTYDDAGEYAVVVTVDDGIVSAEAALEILVEDAVPEYAPEIAVDPAEVAPGDGFRVTGTGFAPDEAVSIALGEGDQADVRSDDDGAVSADLVVPDDASDGAYAVVAVGDVSQQEATAEIRVTSPTPAAQATATSLAAEADDPVAGDVVRLVATVDPGSAAGQVTFLEGDDPVGSATASGGVASVDVRVETSGAHTFTAVFAPDDPDAYEGSASDAVTIEVGDAPVLDARLTLSADSVAQGGSVEATARGFAAGETVTLTLHSDPVQVAEATADGQGGFRIDVAIPASTTVGDHTLVAEGADSGLTAEASLAVTSTTPEPLPPTGGDIGGTVAIAVIALLLLGAVLWILARRRLAR
ncbi:GH92 family glycosyl hydrolase [Microbacterium sp. gxy059]|uniref:GH92 family glycosyl hydrolase n=1 Tax=Microbacterium sp. gxy059 TaxID=2957199 RepID=UPI003D954D60